MILEITKKESQVVKVVTQKTEIIASVIDSFSQYFTSQKFKIKKTADTILATQKKSEVELWLPNADERYYGNYAMFRLTVDLKNMQEFLIILNKNNFDINGNPCNGSFYFKLVQQSKRNNLNKSEYPRFENFEDLLDAAVNYDSFGESESRSSHNDSFTDDFEEDSISIIRTGTD